MESSTPQSSVVSSVVEKKKNVRRPWRIKKSQVLLELEDLACRWKLMEVLGLTRVHCSTKYISLKSTFLLEQSLETCSTDFLSRCLAHIVLKVFFRLKWGGGVERWEVRRRAG